MHIPSASSTRPSTPSSLSSPVINNSNNSTLRGSMILYRLAADELRTPSLTSSEHGRLIPPSRIRNSYHGRKNRDSMMSMSGMSISDDDEDGEDWIFEDEYNDARWNEKKRMSSSTDPSSNATHTPTLPKGQTKSPLNRRTLYSSRGFANLFGLALLLVGLLALFIIYPIATFYHDNGRNHRITTNSRINSTGQAEGDGGDVAPTDSNQGGHGVWKIVDRREQ
ncbi:hypothetical protein L218DRAFT_728971 [Marasmius fiardii PR-910]|nr:hypothetical protein L218DRAFT_728971 [Marasmius fiardii PR-910]